MSALTERIAIEYERLIDPERRWERGEELTRAAFAEMAEQEIPRLLAEIHSLRLLLDPYAMPPEKARLIEALAWALGAVHFDLLDTREYHEAQAALAASRPAAIEEPA